MYPGYRVPRGYPGTPAAASLSRNSYAVTGTTTSTTSSSTASSSTPVGHGRNSCGSRGTRVPGGYQLLWRWR
eukprot:3477436-Rhodomonas_salina.1